MAIWTHLQSSGRTGADRYASTYTYNSRGLRATAFLSEVGADHGVVVTDVGNGGASQPPPTGRGMPWVVVEFDKRLRFVGGAPTGVSAVPGCNHLGGAEIE